MIQPLTNLNILGFEQTQVPVQKRVVFGDIHKGSVSQDAINLFLTLVPYNTFYWLPLEMCPYLKTLKFALLFVCSLLEKPWIFSPCLCKRLYGPNSNSFWSAHKHRRSRHYRVTVPHLGPREVCLDIRLCLLDHLAATERHCARNSLLGQHTLLRTREPVDGIHTNLVGELFAVVYRLEWCPLCSRHVFLRLFAKLFQVCENDWQEGRHRLKAPILFYERLCKGVWPKSLVDDIWEVCHTLVENQGRVAQVVRAHDAGVQ